MPETIEARVEALVNRVGALSPASVSGPTLVYFNIIGIGWPIRALLHVKNVDYDFIPISVEEWGFHDQQGNQVLKHAFRNGHVPLFVDEYTTLNQSNVILTYLAEQHDLMGDGDEQSLRVNEIIAHCYDALFHWNGMLGVTIRRNIPDDVAQARLASFMGDGVWGVVNNGYRNHLNTLLSYLESNPADSGYLVGSRLTVADLHAFNVLCNWYKAFDREVFSTEYPELDAYIHRVANEPGVRDYIEELQEPTTWFQLPQLAMRLTSPEELQGLVRLGF